MSLEELLACAGRWDGDSTLSDPENGIDDVSGSSLTVTPVVGGRFARLDYTWAYRGTPQEGSLLVGQDPKTGRFSAHWIDTWHMGHAAMVCEGEARGADISVRGSYPAPSGPDWGWRIDVAPSRDTLRLAMFNLSPEGEEYPAVAALYARRSEDTDG